MAKHGKANGTAAGGWASEEEWHFELIQPIAATPIKTAIIRSPDHRITGSPDHRITGSSHLRLRGIAA